MHRKAALFYKTSNGAHVGDLFMSAIHTCELNGVNAFEYLIDLQRHADALKETPDAWMPWNYRETLARASTSRSASVEAASQGVASGRVSELSEKTARFGTTPGQGCASTLHAQWGNKEGTAAGFPFGR